MNLTIINNASGTRSYLGGIVTVAEGNSTTISRELNVIIVSDAQFLSDINNRSISLNTGVNENLTPAASIELIKTLARFSTDPIATLFLYYSAKVNIRQTTTAAAGTTVWAMRNPLASPYSLVVERAQLKMTFDGPTPGLTPKLLKYELIRFNSATPSGGTAITPIKMSSLAPASAANVQFLDTGLTMTGVNFEADSFSTVICPAVQGAVSDYQRNTVCEKLGPGEGLAIRVADVAASVGQALAGEFVWSLR